MRFAQTPVRTKLTLVVLFASVLALVLACVGFGVYDRSRATS
jgi:hypothetical protein